MTTLSTIFHQINLHKSKLANFELFKQTESLNKFIILAQEPHTYKGNVTGTPRGLQTHLVGPSPRSCIIHPKILNIKSIPDFCSGDVVSCLWETGSVSMPNIMLISVYWDITSVNITEKLLACISYCHILKPQISYHHRPYLL